MGELTERQQGLARSLLALDAIKLRQEGEEGFRFKIHQTKPDAPLSPIALNLRPPEITRHGEGTLTPEALGEIGWEMYELVNRLGVGYDHIAGIPNAGAPLSEAFARSVRASGRGISRLVLHKEETGIERRVTEQVDGDFKPGETMLLVDDLVTHGGTKLEAITAVRRTGLRVSDLVVLVDREQGGVQLLERNAVATHAVFTLSKMLELYRTEGSISKEIYQAIQRYLQDDRR